MGRIQGIIESALEIQSAISTISPLDCRWCFRMGFRVHFASDNQTLYSVQQWKWAGAGLHSLKTLNSSGRAIASQQAVLLTLH
ncbi:hypothetical protein J6590_029286 [Homalodisca vitripennis]|nr:hypothetical protein J6590_029286 [Homalodisca vitripennis]